MLILSLAAMRDDRRKGVISDNRGKDRRAQKVALFLLVLVP
jgi:hypothetical protein